MLEGLAQDYQLTLPAILRRAEQLYGYREIVTRRPDKSFHRHTFADFVSRSKKLAVALKKLGLEDGEGRNSGCNPTTSRVIGVPSLARVPTRPTQTARDRPRFRHHGPKPGEPSTRPPPSSRSSARGLTSSTRSW